MAKTNARPPDSPERQPFERAVHVLEITSQGVRQMRHLPRLLIGLPVVLAPGIIVAGFWLAQTVRRR